jgi:D-serine deaminase-like pyridoxal phosphate-dependent protein
VLLTEIETPALILDRRRLERNCDRMANQAARLGVKLRPHLKTAKSAQVARIATAGGTSAITVSTLAEAQYFAGHGFTDITYAVGFDPAKLPHVADIQNAHAARINLLVDHPETAHALALKALEIGGPFHVLIEIDCGAGRGGLGPEDESLAIVAATIAGAANLVLEGVLTHAGHSYAQSGTPAIAAIAEDERALVVQAAERLRAAGFPVRTVSVGSTPTAICARSLEGVTEFRPGVYTLFDLDQVARGVCGIEDIAVSVLATVIGDNPRTGRLLIDAGALALSKDLSANDRAPGVGFGIVCPIDRAEPIRGVHVSAVHQEHGFLCIPTDLERPVLRPGDRVRILPNHACMTAAPHDRYFVVDGDGTEVTDVWDKCTGWTAAKGSPCP